MRQMANPTEIRHHIAAVEQTRKITRAMEMVSSNRMRKVMSQIEQNHLYFDSVQRTMKEILEAEQEITHPYMQERHGGHCTFIVISGDKGMCGAYNSNVLNFARERIESTERMSLITIGHTGEEYFRRYGIEPDITLFGIAQHPTLHRARELSREIMALFDSGLTDEIHVIFTSYYGEHKNTPVERRLLPIRLQDYSEIRNTEKLSDIIYTPSPQLVFDVLIPQYVIGILFGVMVQAYTSEHFARMNAMQSANSNAQDMLKKLKIQYNLARQSAITNEIAEITGAAEILRGDDSVGGY